MKFLFLISCVLLTSSSIYADTAREKKLKRKVIKAFKKGGGSKMSQKLRDTLSKKSFSFDGNKVMPSFSHNVFWLNHLNRNFSITPRYTIETITNTIRTIIPAKPEKWHWKITPGKFLRTEKVYVRTDTVNVGWKPDTVINHEATYKTITVSEWGSWKPLTGPPNLPKGRKNLNNWGVKQRAIFLARQAGVKDSKWKDYEDKAFQDLRPCSGTGGGVGSCSGNPVEIAPSSDAKLPDKCSTDVAQCKLFIDGSYCQGDCSNEGNGQYKPTFSAEGKEIEESTKEVIDKEAWTETIKGEEITEDVDVYEDKDIYEEDKKEKVVDEEGEPEKEIITTEEEDRIVRAKKEWKVSFAPAYFIDFDFGKLILNQNDGSGGRFIASVKKPRRVSRRIASKMRQDNLYKGQPSQMQQQGLPPGDIQADNQGPFLVKKFFTITAGLGGTASANYTNAGILSQLGLSAALLPSLGGGATSFMLINDYDKAKKAKHLRIPRSVKDIMKWRDGDTLVYDVHGGIVFSGGVGFYGLAAGVSFVANGIWQRTFSKIDSTTVLAKLERNKMFSIGMYVAAGLAGLSLDKFWMKENALTFAIDIATDRGKELLLQFMRGDMRKLQTAANDPKNLDVVSGMKTKGKTSGKSVSFGIGVPYLPASARWNKASFLNESHTDYLGSKRKKNTTNYAQVFSFKGKFFPLFKNTSEGFFSVATRNSGAVPTFLSSYKTGQYALNYQKSYAKKKDIQKMLKKLLRKTGLIGLLDLEIGEDVPRKVGSVEIKFAIKFKTAATNLLIAQVRNKNLDIFKKIGFGFIEAYFNSLNHKKEDILKLCRVRSLRRCEKKMRKKSSKAFYKLTKALKEMSKYSMNKLKSREKFAKAYAKFGNAMMENPFTLQAVLSMTLGQGADIYLSVESSKTKKYESILRGYPIK